MRTAHSKHVSSSNHEIPLCALKHAFPSALFIENILMIPVFPISPFQPMKPSALETTDKTAAATL